MSLIQSSELLTGALCLIEFTTGHCKVFTQNQSNLSQSLPSSCKRGTWSRRLKVYHHSWRMILQALNQLNREVCKACKHILFFKTFNKWNMSLSFDLAEVTATSLTTAPTAFAVTLWICYARFRWSFTQVDRLMSTRTEVHICRNRQTANASAPIPLSSV